MDLNPTLLHSMRDEPAFPPDLQSCIKALGLYNNVQFVLRLSPEVHRHIAETPTGIYKGGAVSEEKILAFSTYLHETLHWWQHIGSTAGFLLSLTSPLQTHSNYGELKKFLKTVGPKKSIMKYGNIINQSPHIAHTIVNNYMDVEFYKLLVTRPALIPEIIEHPYFECVGHAFQITYSNTLSLLSRSLDRNWAFLPDARKWEPHFQRLRDEKKETFYHGSRIGRAPLGLRELFEGQARFSQLQYLHSAFRSPTWDDFRAHGMLGTLYVDAFELFLKLTHCSWPVTPHDPLIGLFLVVCDIAINPGDGFPIDLQCPETLVFDTDPGTRFVALCWVIANKKPELMSFIKNYSRGEYVAVCDQLCEVLNFPTPLSVAQTVVEWANTQPSLIELTEQDRHFRFSAENLPVRLLFARYTNPQKG